MVNERLLTIPMSEQRYTKYVFNDFSWYKHNGITIGIII